MVERVAVNPEVVAWAADAASAADIHLDRFAKLDDWIGGLLDPTFGQLQDFASPPTSRWATSSWTTSPKNVFP